MFKRYAILCLFLAVLFVGVGSFAGRSPGADANAEQSDTADEAGPWFAGEGQKRQSSIPDKNGGEVRLERAGDSHFYADADINGTRIRMLVDSGASMIALTRADAEAMGIDVDSLPAAGNANTAGGVVPIRPLELKSVRVEGLEVVSVAAAVVDADMPASLLGQSFLARLESVKVEGDTMTLR